jgi:DNA-binding SARP family transcriptional activator
MTAALALPPASIDCRLLGPLSVSAHGAAVPLGGPQQRLVLAVLLSRANAGVVTPDSLIEALWSGVPPRTARKSVQVYVSQLRKVFGDRLSHSGRGLGYSIRLAPEECDAVGFGHLVEAGRRALRAGDRVRAAELLGRAIRLWAGRPFAEFGHEPCLAGEADRLTGRFLSALEDWAELELGLGEPVTVLERLDRIVPRYPLRERLAGAWMRALAATGRTGEALAHFDAVRRRLSTELGTDPGRTLVDLHARLLRGELPGEAPGGVDRRGPVLVRDPVVRTQLPRDLPDFVGRAELIEQVAGLLTGADGAAVDTVVVSGQVGVGKTAFAVRVATRLAARFPDGQVLVELARPDGTAKSLAVVLDELLRLAGLDSGPRPPTHALALWRSWAAGRRLLLVLDGATREDVVRALLPGGRHRVLVTSRGRLSGLESVRWIGLPGLSGSEARELLGRITGPERLVADPAATTAVLDFCDRVPLAVRIAGARLAGLAHLSVAGFAAGLAAAPSALDELSIGDLDVRSRYTALYRALDPARRRAWRRLAAVAVAPVERSGALAALGGEPAVAAAAVEALLGCGLLAVPPGGAALRYEMPRLARLYGAEVPA